jgi:plastocyanin
MPRFLTRLVMPRNTIALLAVLAVSLTLLLAACGGGSTTTGSGSTASSPTASSSTGNTPAASTPTSSAATATAGPVVQIKIIEQNDKYQFSPQTLTIAKGTRVEWINNSDAPHTVTSDDNAFTGSSSFGQGQSFSMVFTTAGTYHYHCSIHTYMTATIIVTA